MGDRAHAGLQMRGGWRGDHDDVHILVRHEVLEACMIHDSILSGEGIPLGPVVVVAGDKPGVLKRIGGKRMHRSDCTCADYADTISSISHVLISLLNGLPRALGLVVWLRDVKASTTTTTT